MKITNKMKVLGAAFLIAGASGAYLIAADHIDAPGVTGAGPSSIGSDITDVYAFANGDNIVFVVNTQGLLSPAATAAATFDEEVMLEINIDNDATKDHIEDLVIQATFKDGKVYVHGPKEPVTTGLTSTLVSGTTVSADITAYGETPVIGTEDGVKVFAGPRDDPFFFDLARFKQITATPPTASSFNDPGTDFFAGLNVMSLVIEVPKSQLGAGPINIWATSNRKN